MNYFYLCIKKGEFAPSYCVTLAGEIGALLFSSSSHRALIFMRYHLQANKKIKAKTEELNFNALQIMQKNKEMEHQEFHKNMICLDAKFCSPN